MDVVQFLSEHRPVATLPAGPVVYVPRDESGEDADVNTVVIAGPDMWSGEWRAVKDVPVEALEHWRSGTPIQDAFPDMPFEDRAFLSSGGYLAPPM